MGKKRLGDKEIWCLYSKVVCRKVGRDGFPPCMISKHEDGSDPRFCRNVPIGVRTLLVESFKSGDVVEI